ncbi:DNA replication/repair protein RecF [Lactobacillus hominis]|uniref:DNA replication and repair protein RecF n=1 Tax=Lactobacillus hominis DSM 23910 = CRBIP 24.179 TaxID=1423758 RepID=I7JV80_9LACO|nr:DNA replication/repair protein RecF [Lactobacillus hominis]KRM85001.1 recombination protein F [Lactobacillus hominis DSM 23910 = CRBIP 24.179]MCT3347979.1 DNA replication/repair protein RecF [Lactobacillus hominis]CCI82371.1 DNA replication and repair protein recF [Lactobacillus hominis DSM 23910 = CRBIP 24.179]
MYLENLALKDFRNFSTLQTDFDPQINIFLGQNAQGKTNLLEAIYFLALTRSHRTSTDKELIRFGSKYAGLQGKVHKSQVEVELKLRLSPKGKKAWINRLEQKKLSKYVGQMNAILFSPEDLALVKGAPALRRRFMDLEFGQINAEYLYFSSQYRQVLQQKNNYLKQLSLGKAKDKIFLDVLSDQLAGIAAEIIYRRLNFVKLLNSYAHDAHSQISANKEQLEIYYRPSINEIEAGDQVDEIYHKVLDSFHKNKANEIRKGTTLTGPHRDDLLFKINGKNAHDYASQGQQRTIALSIKLAEIQLVHHLTNEYPILLLDDVMSELDHNRQSSLLNYIHGKTQTFITTTDLEGISWEVVKTPRIYYIKSGIITKEEN